MTKQHKEHKNVDVEFDNGIAIMTIKNPPVNTLSDKTIRDLHEALSLIESNNEVKVVLLQGSNGHFVAGAELKEFNDIQTKEQGTLASYQGYHLMDRIETFPKLVVALIEGACLGGGLELALACHVRYGAENSIYGLPEVSLGLIPGAGGTQRLPRLIGISKAKLLILTGERIDAKEAEKLGVIDGVFSKENLLEEGKNLARKVTRNGSTAIEYAIRAVNAGWHGSSNEGYRTEGELFGACFETEDKKERIKAFLERRK